jgi:hypothetical protein
MDEAMNPENDKPEQAAIPWQQPLFLVYSFATDQMVPLTQERLDGLLATERSYSELLNEVRKIAYSRLIQMDAPPSVLDRWKP